MERVELKARLLALPGAVERRGFVFLSDPHWSVAERGEFDRFLAAADHVSAPAGDGWLCVRTGGTGGVMKFARHDEMTITAAVRGFCAHFGVARVNAVGVLPEHHVSGLMARLRCAFTGGSYLEWDWKRLEAGEAPSIEGDNWMLSLVPTQLQRLLKTPALLPWLRRFQIIFLGGGPTWASVADAGARENLRVSLSYGMTETAAMVTALRPEEFLAGARSAGTPLPHARVNIGPDGTIRISGESVFRGYFPELRAEREFATEDIGAFDERGCLHVHGRRDAMIITGGRKVQPAEIEAVLRASGEFSDVAVIGIPDGDWGEAVVACYPASDTPDTARAIGPLASHQRPKWFVPIPKWPRNVQGKVDRAALRAAAITACEGKRS